MEDVLPQHTKVRVLGHQSQEVGFKEAKRHELSSRLTFVLCPCETGVQQGGSNFSKGGGAAPHL